MLALELHHPTHPHGYTREYYLSRFLDIHIYSVNKVLRVPDPLPSKLVIKDLKFPQNMYWEQGALRVLFEATPKKSIARPGQDHDREPRERDLDENPVILNLFPSLPTQGGPIL